MQQRVGIARALAVNPQILFFDEPFSALDPLIRREMQNELINLQQMMQKTIIFITHDFLEAVKLGDYIAIMKDGEVVQVGTPDQVIMNPANAYVQEFTKDVPRSRVLSAAAIMHECQVVVSENDSPAAALTQLQAKGSNAVFVVAENGRFLGVLSQEEVEEGVTAKQPQLRALVSSPQPTVLPRTILGNLISVVAARATPVPVVDSSHKLRGALDQATVILALGGGMDEDKS
jgi:glycine betaine/proline transport system ATP-binding protein